MALVARDCGPTVGCAVSVAAPLNDTGGQTVVEALRNASGATVAWPADKVFRRSPSAPCSPRPFSGALHDLKVLARPIATIERFENLKGPPLVHLGLTASWRHITDSARIGDQVSSDGGEMCLQNAAEGSSPGRWDACR
jgi:hypothetical protein